MAANYHDDLQLTTLGSAVMWRFLLVPRASGSGVLWTRFH